MPTTDLNETDETTIDQLVDLFLEERRADNAKSTYYNNKGHLEQFRSWCDDNDVIDIGDLNGQTLLQYKLHLKNDPDKNRVTVGNHFSTLRTFFTWSARYDFTDATLATAMESPEFSKSGNARSRMIPFDHAKDVLDYMMKFEYAQTRHVIFVILWHTGCRRRALCGLDLDDYKPVKEREHGRYGLLSFHHRPDTDTPLKNDEAGEREVMIWPKYGEIIEDYIRTHRKPKTDEYGRDPLVTSPHGRYKKNSIQRIMNAMTRPCKLGMDCPHERDPADCEATDYDAAAQCPSSYSSHPIRRAAITYHLEEKDWTYEGASGRFDVSVPVLKEHYDESTKGGRRKTRAAQFFNDSPQGGL